MSGRLMTALLAAGALGCLLAMAILFSIGVKAQGRCAPRDEVVKVLAQKYSERVRAVGILSDLALMEVYVSEKGTWTILITNRNGMACIQAAGEAWDELPPIPKGERS
jgi:hypothetical protein